MRLSIKVFLLALMAAGALAARAEPLGIAYFSGSARSKIGALIMVEVYKRANLAAVAVSMPGIRNAPAAEADIVVGESVRIYDYVDAHPTLTRVEPPVTEWTTVAFYHDTGKVRLQTANDLHKYRVGYVRGTRAAEDLIAEQHLTNLEGVGTPDILFRMLNADRFDVALDGGTNGAYWIRKNGYQHIAELELNRIPLYHILSPKYRDLAPKLSSVIKQLNASGALPRIASEAEREVLDKGVD